MSIDLSQIRATTQRYNVRTTQRNRNERLIREGRYLEADSPGRVERFLARSGFSPSEAHEMLRNAAEGLRTAAPGREPDALERVLGTNDLMGVAFLESGLNVSRAVGRVWIGVSGGMAAGYGTGFLVSPRLLLTNNHVLGDRATARRSLVEFDYQVGIDGRFLTTAAFSLDPDTFFFTDQHLDYALVGVHPSGANGRSLTDFGWNPLIEEEGKAIVSQWLNIIQHPNGEVKQLALRENQLVDVLEEFLQYKTDTAPGSSGSPVFNDRWEVVGLHHSGIWDTNSAGQVLAIDGRVWDETMGEHRIRWIANEGVRISRILSHLRQQTMDAAQRRLFDEIFSAPPPPTRVPTREQAGPAMPESPGAGLAVAVDGTATWIIPLSVSIRLGGQTVTAPAIPDQPTLPVIAPPPVPPPAADKTPKDSESVLAAARRELGGRADVLRVRLGYVFKDGWITDERAIVVTVRQKKTIAALREAVVSPLPETFGGMPVEVTGPTLADVVGVARGPAVAAEAFSRSEVLREEIVYVPPSGVPLNPVTDTMRVVAHVSPDTGWTQLSAFLGATRRQLTVGMYDFGAPHILAAVQSAAQKESFSKLILVMQRGESLGGSTKADDLTDDEVVEKLSRQLGDQFENAWVRIGPANGWVARSYHIKVAVRDQKAFWLSSGNWQSSNQPNADPLSENPPRRIWLDRYNREWHAIVEHPGLAKTFEKYLLHDFRNNREDGAEEALTLDLPDLLVPDSLFLATEAAPVPRYFAPFEDNRTFTVRPLLTPDNYHQHVLELVRSAKEEILLQNQTFNAPSSQGKLKALIAAIRERQQAGVRVRVIFRIINPADARENLEALKDFGFPSGSIKVQGNCHTKGIIVDRRRVLLGSQNWSETGVSTNRDASLLFDDEPLAQYFAEIFDYDWQSLAKANIGNESVAIEAALANEPTPPGMIRLNGKDYMELL